MVHRLAYLPIRFLFLAVRALRERLSILRPIDLVGGGQRGCNVLTQPLPVLFPM
jgi:hypothetical protein